MGYLQSVCSFAVSKIVEEFAFVNGFGFEGVNPFTLHFVLFPVAFVDISIRA
jgi:hypothetical protein